MLEAAGGGGGTDWMGMSMEQIQQLAQSPDIDAHYQIVDGWQKSFELVADHMSQVMQYRDALAAAWPPEKSSAAKAYIDRLNTLIGHLQETQNAALANHDALSSATLSLSLAKTQMTKLYNQWDANNKTLLAFNQQQAQKKAQAQTGRPTPSPSPSGDEPPPVTADQQEALRLKAVTLMSSVSSDLAQAQLKVVRPAPYDPSDVFTDHNDPNGTQAHNPPTLPPIVPISSSSTPSRGASGSSSFSSTSAKTTFPTTSPAAGPSLTAGTTNQPGLVLGGTNPPTTPPSQPPTLTNPITVPPTGGGGPVTGPGLLPPTTGPVAPGGTLPEGIGRFSTGPGSLKGFRGGVSEGGLRAMPPGGVIGRTPSGAAFSELGESRPGPQRVNPVGGMIGDPGVGGGMAGGGRSVRPGRNGMRNLSQQSYGQVGGRRIGPSERSEDTHWDPDDPWATAEGVDPVVLPPVEQRIDPGPAIGLG